MDASPIALSTRGVSRRASGEELIRLRATYLTQHHVRLPGLLSADVLTRVSQWIDERQFYRREHKGVGVEMCLPDECLAARALQFVLNNRDLFELIRAVTECPSIGCFNGRIFRMEDKPGQYDQWHTDWVGYRLVGMSINLSPAPYRGGALELRGGAPERTWQLENPGYGDALVFRLGPDLEHRIAAVEGEIARTAFAGWFCSEPEYLPGVRSSGARGDNPTLTHEEEEEGARTSGRR
jgi:hypothetical protein